MEPFTVAVKRKGKMRFIRVSIDPKIAENAVKQLELKDLGERTVKLGSIAKHLLYGGEMHSLVYAVEGGIEKPPRGDNPILDASFALKEFLDYQPEDDYDIKYKADILKALNLGEEKRNTEYGLYTTPDKIRNFLKGSLLVDHFDLYGNIKDVENKMPEKDSNRKAKKWIMPHLAEAEELYQSIEEAKNCKEVEVPTLIEEPRAPEKPRTDKKTIKVQGTNVQQDDVQGPVE